MSTPMTPQRVNDYAKAIGITTTPTPTARIEIARILEGKELAESQLDVARKNLHLLDFNAQQGRLRLTPIVQPDLLYPSLLG